MGILRTDDGRTLSYRELGRPDTGHFIFIEAADPFREAVRVFLSAGA